MKWYEEPLFDGTSEDERRHVNNFATPAFRLSVQSSIYHGHPLDHVAVYEELFAVFKPILQRDAERLLMTETAGRNPRRRKSIKEGDWHPFEYMRSVIPDDDRYFVGFDFQSGFNGDDRYDIGPTKFYFVTDRNSRLEATIPVADFEAGSIDIQALKDCLLKLPVFSALAGYGMCISDTFDWPVDGLYRLHPIARKFPVLDICRSDRRQWFSDTDRGFNEYWIGGINWLTLVCEPFVSALGGVKQLTTGLNSAISCDVAGDSILFQLGPRPITGERGKDDDLLPLYFELGERLKPIGEGYPSLTNGSNHVFGTNSMRAENLKWSRRFYDQQWFEESSK